MSRRLFIQRLAIQDKEQSIEEVISTSFDLPQEGTVQEIEHEVSTAAIPEEVAAVVEVVESKNLEDAKKKFQSSKKKKTTTKSS